MTNYHFDHKGRIDAHAVAVDTVEQYGYWEHDTMGEGGGLWFDGRELVDHDGTATLPRRVAKLLRAMGFVVSADFE